MRRYFLLMAVLLNAVWASAQYSGSGNGTESDPYLIFNETQLYQMNNFLGSSHEGVVFKLMKDLDLTEFISENFPSEGWIPIGVESTSFQGKFYGNNHKVSGLWINRPSTNNVGFFGYVSNATINDLTIESTHVYGDSYVGTLVGYANNVVIGNCHILGIGFDNVSGKYVGGLVGYIKSSVVNNCHVKINMSANSYVGGIIGAISGTTSIQNSKFEGDIVANSYVGGVVGTLLSSSSVSFYNSHTNCKITNNGNYTGGIVGISNGGCIASMGNCSHFGDINGKNYVGGLVGAVTGSIEATPVYYGSSTYKTNTKEWTSTAKKFTTGSVSPKINNCTAIGNISGTSNVGGLFGSDKVSITYSFVSAGANNSSGSMGGKDYNTSTRYLWRNSSCMTESSYYFYTPTDKKNIISYNYNNSYYSGIINGTTNVGGIVGYKECGEIAQCYTHASVYGNSRVGGIVGDAFGTKSELNDASEKLTLKSNVAINNTISATISDIGRIYGKKENDYITIGALASAEGNRALTTTKVIKQGVVQEVADDFQNGNVMGKSLLELKANYVALGWNFDDNWEIIETECYPYKKYQAAPPVIESKLVSQETEISGSSLNGGIVYLLYKDRDAISTNCNGHVWNFSTEKLQSGATVQLYAVAEGMIPSYLTSSTVGYPGSGTEADPYRIYTAEDLQGASNKGYYKLMNDIDLSAWINENSPTEGWVSIGRNSGEATYINGDGHKVTGLWINTTEDYTGLFSNFSAGIIKNLTVEVASGKKVKGGDFTGILIGRNANGQLLNCTVKGDVEGTKHVGGVTGYSEHNTISCVYFEGSVLSKVDNACAGGAIGYMDGGTLTKSYADNILTTTGTNAYAGGLVGYSKGEISLSYSTGTITTSGDNSYTGGLVGYAYSPISNCYSTAKTTGTYYIGGLCAYTYSSIDKCYATGDVFGIRYGAGVIAQLDGVNAKLSNSIAANSKLELTDQASWGSRVIGGFRNGATEPDNSNYALSTMQVSLNGVPQKKTDDAVEGIAKTADILMTADTYRKLGWDMFNIWTVKEGQDYPTLRAFIEEEEVVETTLGDVNNDEAVNVQDYVAVGNYILGNAPEGFNATAADINEDTEVNVQDYVGVANIILYDNPYGEKGGTRAKALNGTDEYYALSVTAKGNNAYSVSMNNSNAISAMQMEICLPENMNIEDIILSARASKRHNVTYRQTAPDTWKVLIASMHNDDFDGNEGEIMTFTTNANSAANITIDNILISDSQMVGHSAKAVSLSPETTGIEMFQQNIKNESLYDLMGRKVNVAKKQGIYIKKGKKVIF